VSSIRASDGPRRAEIEKHVARAIELIQAGAAAADKALR